MFIFSPSDSVHQWSGLCDWLGENFQILLPASQVEGYRLLHWWDSCCLAWVASHWNVCRAVWLLFVIQVSKEDFLDILRMCSDPVV